MATVRVLVLLRLLALLPFWPAGVLAESGWRTDVRQDDLLIESRPLAGGLREYRAEARDIDAPLQAFLNLLQDTRAHGLWMRNTRSVTVLQQFSAHENRVRTEFVLPWPFMDRELINRSRYWQEKDSCVIRLEAHAEPYALPPNPGLVRIRRAQGLWRMVPQPGGGMHLHYQGFFDPGGQLPGWLIGSQVLAELQYSLSRLRVVLRLPRFHGPVAGIDGHCRPSRLHP